MTTAGAAAFTFDANGNTVTRAVTTGSEQEPVTLTTTYVYNSADRMERVLLPDGSVAVYTYDPFGRRVKKTVTPPAESGAAATTTYYLYADEGLIGEYDASGNLKKGYGWKPGGIWGTGPLFMLQSGSYYFYHNDHLGTPQKMTDEAGTIVWSATYSAFGKATVAAGSTVENNLRFPGQYADAETGLHYNWQRYYDPETGRYTQTDPIGLRAGDSNYYRYVGNIPLRYLDPLGLDWVDDLANASAGFGDTITFGGTAWIRNQWNKSAGLDNSVNKCSGFYKGGHWAGEAWWLAFGGASARAARMARGATAIEEAAAAEEAAVETTRVGRWMSKKELDLMRQTGKVQESYTGTTYVASPANWEAFVSQTTKRSAYVEFDVPTSSVKMTNPVNSSCKCTRECSSEDLSWCLVA